MAFFLSSCDKFELPELPPKEVEVVWAGSELEFEAKFENLEVNGSYVFYDLEENLPYSGNIEILNSEGDPWLSHEYENGLENGERIVWQNGKVYEKYLYKNGKLVKSIIKRGKLVK